MARVTKKKEEKKEVAEVKTLTRAEKKTATQTLIKEVLRKNAHRHNDLIDEVSKIYTQKFDGEDTENINDVKGRVGSVLDIMKKEGEVLFDGGMYVLKEEKTSAALIAATEAKPKKTTRAKAKKEEKKNEDADAEEKPQEQLIIEEKSAKKTAKKSAKTLKAKEEEKTESAEKKEPLPPAPLQPIAPVAPTTPEIAPEPIPENAPKKEKKNATSAKAKKAKVVVEKETTSQTVKTENEPPMVALSEEITPVKEEKVEIKNPPVLKEKAEIAPKNVVDMSFLFGNVKAKEEKPVKKDEAVEKSPVKEAEKTSIKPEKEEKQEKETAAQPPIVKHEAAKQEPVKQEPIKQEIKHPMRRAATRENVKNIHKAPERPQTADERLREAFLKRLRALGGDYFEYYSIYLLERYSMKNGRRLESLRISGGDHDGGIDGEIELTDRLGFKETIYIQAKNWDPEKGKEEYWVVGETLLQQFIGACACRQAKDGKQHCRGIFITTSRFTPEAKHILDAMSDKIVGYDGADLYEAAKECKFGLLYENGNWKLDEKLLSGVRAFFSMM